MEFLERLLPEKLSNSNAQGDWTLVQWAPDKALGERLNIGVVFQEHGSQRVCCQMLDLFDRVECLYGDNAQFQARLACEVVASHFDSNNSIPLEISSNIYFARQGFAQGDSHESVLNRLYKAAVPLGRRKKIGSTTKRFSSKSRKKIVDELRSEVTNLSTDAEAKKLFPKNPYILDGRGGRLYMPIRGDRSIATVASAVYASTDRASIRMLSAHLELQLATGIKEYDKTALFILRPTHGLPDSQIASLDNEIDKLDTAAKKQNIWLGVRDESDELAEDVLEWSDMVA